MTATATATGDDGYGGFSLGPMQLALPMSALREVVPCRDLTSLPCLAPFVIGGIDLRGVIVPVVDLRILLARERTAAPYPSVVIMVHDGRLLGLMADGVTGIFSRREGGLKRVCVEDPTAAVFAGSIRRDDDGSLVSLLSPDALSKLHQVPMIEDPEPERQQMTSAVAGAVIEDRSVQTMLMRCGRIPMAIDAMAVHTAMSDPTIDRSVLTVGACRGMLDHGGCRVPAVDLLALCGLGELDRSRSAQAFLVQLEAGLVALLVDEVFDVVRTMPEDVVPVPAAALPNPELFSGVLPTSALPTEVAAAARHAINPYLLVDGAALKRSPTLNAIARLGAPGPRPQESTAVASASGTASRESRSMITYDLFAEEATPIEQVAEILPYEPGGAIFDPHGPLVGLTVDRGRSIPVWCLRRLAGIEPVELTHEASVLVVQSEGEWMGFAITRLGAIEIAEWEPVLPDHELGGHDPLARSLNSRRLALVRSGGNQRLLRVLDLDEIARWIRTRKKAG